MTRPTARLGVLMGASVAAAVLFVLATTGARADSAAPLGLPARPVPTIVPDGTVCYEFPPGHGCAIRLRLSGPVDTATRLVVSTSDGTARAGVDYSPLNQLLVVIPAGETGVDVRVAIVADSIAEGDETFTLLVSSASEPGRILSRNPVVIRDGAPPK